jgi:hypothetical protein
MGLYAARKPFDDQNMAIVSKMLETTALNASDNYMSQLY